MKWKNGIGYNIYGSKKFNSKRDNSEMYTNWFLIYYYTDLVVFQWELIFILQSRFYKISYRFDAPFAHPDVRMLTYV